VAILDRYRATSPTGIAATSGAKVLPTGNSVQGWSSADQLVLAKTGKVMLLPGDQVHLQSAPEHGEPGISDSRRDISSEDIRLSPMAIIGGLEDTGIFGQVAIGSDNPGEPLHLNNGRIRVAFDGSKLSLHCSVPLV